MLIFAAAVFTREIAVAAACVGLVVLLLRSGSDGLVRRGEREPCRFSDAGAVIDERRGLR